MLEENHGYVLRFEPDHHLNGRYAIIYAITPTQARDKAIARYGAGGWTMHDDILTAGVRRLQRA